MLAYVSQITLAQREWEFGSSALAWQHLEACQWNLRGWEHRYLCTLFPNNQVTIQGFMAFSPDGKRIVSGGQDHTLKIWDADRSIETLTLKGHTGRVTSVAFSPDGSRIASAGSDGTVLIWEATRVLE